MTANTSASADEFYLNYTLSEDLSTYGVTKYPSDNNLVGGQLGNVTTTPTNGRDSLIGFTFSDSESSGKSIKITTGEDPLTLGLFIVTDKTTFAEGQNFGSVNLPAVSEIKVDDLSGGITGIGKISLVYFSTGANLSTDSSFQLSNELLSPGSVKQIVAFDLGTAGTSFTRTGGNHSAVLAGLGSTGVTESNETLEAIGALIGSDSSIDLTKGQTFSFAGLVVPTGSVNMTAYGVKVNGGDLKTTGTSTITISAAVFADSTFSTEGGGTYAAYGLYVENPPLEPELNAVENPPELVLDGVSFSAVRGITNLSAENTTGSAIYVGTGGNVTLTGTTKVNQELANSLTRSDSPSQSNYNFSNATNIVVPLDAINVVEGGSLNVGNSTANAIVTYNGDILIDGGTLAFGTNEQKSSLTPDTSLNETVTGLTHNITFQNGATLRQGTGENAGSIEAQNIYVYGSTIDFSGTTTASEALVVGKDESGISNVTLSGTTKATGIQIGTEGGDDTSSVTVASKGSLSVNAAIDASEDEPTQSNVYGDASLIIQAGSTFKNAQYSEITVNTGGTLTVEGKPVDGEGEGASFTNNGTIIIASEATANMNADFSSEGSNTLGTFITSGKTTFASGLNLNGESNPLTVEGGETTASGPITVSGGSKEAPTLNVTGGALNMGEPGNGVALENTDGFISVGNESGTINAYGGFTDNSSATTSVLSGGTLNVPSELTVAGTVNVAGGTLKADNSLKVSKGANFNVSGENGNVTVGGLFTNEGTTIIGQGEEEPNNQSGGTVYANGGFLSNGTKTNVNQGGKLVVSGGEGDNAGLNIGSGTFGINGGTVEVSGPFNMKTGTVNVGGTASAGGVLDLSGVTEFGMEGGDLNINAYGTLVADQSNLLTEKDGTFSLSDGVDGNITFNKDSTLSFTGPYTLDWLNDFTAAAGSTSGIQGSEGNSLKFASGVKPSMVMTGEMVDDKGNVQDSVTMEDLANVGSGSVLAGVTLDASKGLAEDGSFTVGESAKDQLNKSLGFGSLNLGEGDQLNITDGQYLTLTGKEGQDQNLVQSTTGDVTTNVGEAAPGQSATLNFGTPNDPVASYGGTYNGDINVKNGNFNVTGPAGEEENPSYSVREGNVTLGTAGKNSAVGGSSTSGDLNVKNADLTVSGDIDVLGSNPGASNGSSSIVVDGGTLSAEGALTGAQPAEGKTFNPGDLLSVEVTDGSAKFHSVGTEEAPLQGASFGITDGSFASSGDINLGPVTAGGDKPTIELDNGSFTAEGNMTLGNGHSIEMYNSEFSAGGNMNLFGTNVTLGGDATGQNNTFSSGGNATLSGVTIAPADPDSENPDAGIPSSDFHFGSLTTEPLTQGSGAATNTSVTVPQGSFIVDNEANIGEGSTLVLGGILSTEEGTTFGSNLDGNGINASFGALDVTGSVVAVGGPNPGSPTTNSSSLAIGSLDLSTPEVAEGEDQPSNGGLIIGSGVRASVGAGTGQEAVDAAVGRAQSALNAFAGRPNVPNINSNNIIDTPASSFAYFAGSNTIGESNGLLVNAGEGAALTPGNVTIGNGNTSTVLAVDGVPGQSTFVGSEDANFTLGSEGATNTQVVVFAHGNGTGYIATGFDPENITNYLAENPNSIIGPYMYNVAWDTENENPTAFTMQLDPAKVDAIGSVIPNSTKAAGDLFGTEGGEYILNILDGIDGSPASIAQARGLLNQLALRGAAAHAHEIGINVSSMVMDSVTNHGTHLSGYSHEAGMGDMWIDLNWNHSKADFTAGGLSNGYKMDLYGATMGADYFVGNGFSVGAAVSVGGGETKAKGTDSGQKTNTTYWGVNLYGVYDAASFNVIGHVGFMQALNKSKYAGIKARPDTNIWTVGVRAEKDFAVTDKICITPHVGVRYLNVDVDSVNAQGFHYEFKKANLVQFPFGVTATGIAKLDSGAEIKPFIDLQITPTAGKKKLENSFSIMGSEAKDVINSTVATTMLYQAKVGINAVNGAHSFGLNFGIGAGKDSRLDTALQAKYRFTF